LRIIVCSPELAGTVIEQQRLVVAITDPDPVGKETLLPPRSDQVLDTLVLAFADLDPANLQETWGEPIPPYDRTADQLIMTCELGKKLWSFLLRRRDPAPAVIVLQDDRLQRSLSLAYAIADVLALRRAHTIFQVEQEAWHAQQTDVPPNRHIYEMTKRTRHTVV
jgi:hypothetical protein